GSGYFLGIPMGIYSVLATLALTHFLCRRTALGLFIEAVGNNPVASHYIGMNTRMVKAFVYIFGGFCAGLAGLMISSNIGAADASNSGLYLELDAILAVVIGGTPLQGGRFSLWGSLLGVLIIQTVVTTINTRGIGAEYTLIIKAVVVLSVCLFQSESFRKKLGLAGFSRKSKPA
ncbi:MAG: ABC transporter permease, partial [Bdellovibrionales bacterium]|nr:ABC transporter permease [Oligoflexia bacterium]